MTGALNMTNEELWKQIDMQRQHEKELERED